MERDKLSLVPILERNYVVLTLLDNEFRDLFNDLILSMRNAVWDIARPDLYSDVFLKTFHRWARFFHEDRTQKLSRIVVQGIFGEMVYLRKLLGESPAARVNQILRACA